MRMVVGAVMAMAVLMVFLNADAECFLYYFFLGEKLWFLRFFRL